MIQAINEKECKQGNTSAYAQKKHIISIYDALKGVNITTNSVWNLVKDYQKQGLSQGIRLVDFINNKQDSGNMMAELSQKLKKMKDIV